MNKTKAAKYRQAMKELTAKQKAAKTKHREIRLRRDKLKATNCTPPKDKPIELKIETAPVPVTEVVKPDAPPMSAARRAFLSK